MVISAESPPKRVLPAPDVLRRTVIQQLERLPDEGVAVLHDLAQELEVRAAWSAFSEGMADDWAAGKYADLDESLTRVREALRQSSAE